MVSFPTTYRFLYLSTSKGYWILAERKKIFLVSLARFFCKGKWLKEKRFSMRRRLREQLAQPSCARDKSFAYFSRSHYFLFECVKPRIYTCFAQPSPFCSHTSKPSIPLPARDTRIDTCCEKIPTFAPFFSYNNGNSLKRRDKGY